MKRLLLISAAFLCACGFTPKPPASDEEKIDIPICEQIPVSEVLLDKLDDFIRLTDSTGYNAWPVVEIFFEKSSKTSNKDCVWIVNNMFYDSINAVGYFYYKDKVIGIANRRGRYFDDYIDTTKLTRGVPPDVPTVYKGYSEPWIQDFKIINSDSLVLVYNGFL